jgi:site-specific DNA-methyltransferase (cytosine-N4-specific)
LLFLLTKQSRYYFNLDPIRAPLLRPDTPEGSRVTGGQNKGGQDASGRLIGQRSHGGAPEIAPSNRAPSRGRRRAGSANRPTGIDSGHDPGSAQVVTRGMCGRW